jgi:hypothetical protein
VKEHLEELKLGGRPMTKLELANKEIERLNNIINELEKYIDEDDWTSVNGEIAVRLIKLKLQELKGSEKE